VIWYEFTGVLEEQAASTFYPELGSNMFLQNVGQFLPYQIMLYPRNQ
jgi:hypothetical protein